MVSKTATILRLVYTFPYSAPLISRSFYISAGAGSRKTDKSHSTAITKTIVLQDRQAAISSRRLRLTKQPIASLAFAVLLSCALDSRLELLPVYAHSKYSHWITKYRIHIFLHANLQCRWDLTGISCTLSSSFLMLEEFDLIFILVFICRGDSFAGQVGLCPLGIAASNNIRCLWLCPLLQWLLRPISDSLAASSAFKPKDVSILACHYHPIL